MIIDRYFRIMQKGTRLPVEFATLAQSVIIIIIM